MNTLIEIRTNISYAKTDGEFVRVNELVLLMQKPSYKLSNEGTVVREAVVEEARFSVTEKGIDEIIAHLLKIKNATEEELS